MTTTSICIIAAMVIVPLLAESIFRMIRGYIIFDRIDLHVEVPVVPFRDLSKMAPGEPSTVIRERIIRARNIQTERFRSSPQSGGQRGAIHCNAQMTEHMLHEFAEPDARSLDMLRMKSVFGTSPNNYLLNRRIERAKELLRQPGAYIADVAYRSGFADPKYFSKCFKKLTGQTPSEFQKL